MTDFMDLRSLGVHDENVLIRAAPRSTRARRKLRYPRVLIAGSMLLVTLIIMADVVSTAVREKMPGTSAFEYTSLVQDIINSHGPVGSIVVGAFYAAIMVFVMAIVIQMRFSKTKKIMLGVIGLLAINHVLAFMTNAILISSPNGDYNALQDLFMSRVAPILYVQLDGLNLLYGVASSVF